MYAIDFDAVLKAKSNIEGLVHETPVHTSQFLSQKVHEKVGKPVQVYLKLENLQKTGAFKIRGALNATAQLKGPVVSHSSGNHAQALALASSIRGLEAHIVMPNDSNPAKIAATKGYGATVHLCEPNLESRDSTAFKVQQEIGATMVHPYNNPLVMAGQGTLMLEFLHQTPHLDALIIPVGGGGLLSGCCIAAKGISPLIHIFAAEPMNARDCFDSFQVKSLVPVGKTCTIADGLRTSMGDLTWPIIRDHVEQVYLVSEEEIVQSMKWVYERCKLVIEPSAAVGIAVALFSTQFHEQVKAKGIENIGIVICGGNADLDHLPWCK